MSHLLAGKCAVVYGAGGAIGGAVAKAFAAEGARVALAGRTAKLGYVIGKPILEATVEDFVGAVQAAMRTHFTTVTAPARRLARAFEEQIAAQTLLKRLPRPAETGAAAAFAASGRAAAVTGAVLNGTCGALVD